MKMVITVDMFDDRGQRAFRQYRKELQLAEQCVSTDKVSAGAWLSRMLRSHVEDERLPELYALVKKSVPELKEYLDAFPVTLKNRALIEAAMVWLQCQLDVEQAMEDLAKKAEEAETLRHKMTIPVFKVSDIVSGTKLFSSIEST